MVPVYETGRAEHALEMESALIQVFHGLPRCTNLATGAGGGMARRSGRSCVYVASRFR